MEYPHGQEKLKSHFTTTTTVGIGKNVPNRQNMTLAKTRSLPYSNGTPTAAQTATTVPKRTTTTALLVTLAAAIISLAVWGSWMGSGATTTLATKMDDDACPPQVVVTV